MLNAGFSFAEGGYVPLGPSGVTVANSELDVYIFHWIRFCAINCTVYGCMGCMVIWLHGSQTNGGSSGDLFVVLADREERLIWDVDTKGT